MPKQSLAQHDNVGHTKIKFHDLKDMDISIDPLLPNHETAENIEIRIKDELYGAMQLARSALDALKEEHVINHGAFRTAFGVRSTSNSQIIRRKLEAVCANMNE